jgi:hypothetical protein
VVTKHNKNITDAQELLSMDAISRQVAQVVEASVLAVALLA